MDLDALFPFVAPEAKGCPNQTLLHHIRQALIRFCDQTLAWQADLPTITTTATANEYAMTLPSEATLVKLMTADLDGVPLNVNGDTSRGSEAVWTEDRASVLMSFQPEAGKKLSLRAAFRPSQAASTLPPALFELYAGVIATGALATLMDMPGDVTWADPVKARDKRTQFDDGCNSVATEVSKTNSRKPRRVRPFMM